MSDMFGMEPDGESGGFADWFSLLPAILGTAASVRNPAAGAALFGLGNQLRYQRMYDLSQQREKRAAEAQRRRQEMEDAANRAGVAGIPGYMGPTDVPFATASRLHEMNQQQMQRALENERRTSREAATRGATEAATRFHTGNEPAYDLLQEFGQHFAGIPVESQAQFQPTMKMMQEAVTREGQASMDLPAVLDPEQRQGLVTGYGRGSIQSLPQALEQRGYDPMLSSGGQEFLTKREEQEYKKAQATTGKMEEDVWQRYMRGETITPPQAQRLKVLGPYSTEPNERTVAALGRGIHPGALQLMPPGSPQQMQGATIMNQAASTAEAQRAAERERAQTPPLLERARGAENIQTAGAVDRFKRLAPLQLAQKGLELAQESDFKRGQPLSPDDSHKYTHKMTFNHPPAGMSSQDVEKSGEYVQTPKGFTKNSAVTVASDLQEALKIIMSSPDLWTPGTGNDLTDNARAGYARLAWLKKQQVDPRIGRVKSILSNLANHARNAGDTANIAIEEQARQEAGLGLQPGVTRERAAASVLRTIDRVSDAWKSHGLSPIPLDPSLREQAQEAIKKYEDVAERRRKRQGSTGPVAPEMPSITDVQRVR